MGDKVITLSAKVDRATIQRIDKAAKAEGRTRAGWLLRVVAVALAVEPKA